MTRYTTHHNIRWTVIAFAALIAILLPVVATAQISSEAGPYHVELKTQPDTVPVGKANLRIRITANGQPVTNAQVSALAKMPTMSMGEVDQTAAPVANEAGVYSAPAVFAMEGDYTVSVKISADKGPATAQIAIKTGQNTATTPALNMGGLVPYIALILGLVFVVYRVVITRQHIHLKALLNRQVVGGLALVLVIYAIANYAIGHLRRPGAMTPIEAQAMEMNTPAPPGVAAVTLAPVTDETVGSTVTYTGQAVAYNEQDVTPRVTGWIQSMPLYVGQKVTAGDLIARLDTSQSGPQVEQQRAGVSMAQAGIVAAQKDYEKATQDTHQAHHEEAVQRQALKEAQANVEGAKQDRAAAEEEITTASARIDDTLAQQQAVEADRQYWRQELAREQNLLKAGAVSREEYQREQSQAAAAEAKYTQATAAVAQARAQLRSAQALARKADSAILAANARYGQVNDELGLHGAHIASNQAAAESAKQRVFQARAALKQANAQLMGAVAARGYSEVRSLVGGVVTQRLLGPGQLVNAGQPIIKVAQLNPIRLQANVAESDLARIRLGAQVTVRTQNGVGAALSARVTSISPSLDPVARTGIVEALAPNGDLRFAPGQYLTMDIRVGEAHVHGLTIPSDAVITRTTPSATGVISVQTSASVWVATPAQKPNQFTVKLTPITVADTNGARTQVVSGLSASQQVVTSGYEYLKDGDTVYAAETASPPPSAKSPAYSAHVEVTPQCFVPASIAVQSGKPTSIVFLRTTDKTCATAVNFPALNHRVDLPLNTPVEVQLGPLKPGEYEFVCPMNMVRGKVVVQ